MMVKRLQLALIHTAVAVTLVPINSTLNRVMIKELGISAALVALLASLPYVFSPLQVIIGSYSDRHPVLGLRRTPYIVLGLLFCAVGVVLAPLATVEIPVQPILGLILTLLVFMAWGMGFNLASVSYLALASEISGEKGRSRTVAIMWVMMVVGIILTAATLGGMLERFDYAALNRAFLTVAAGALALGTLGLIGLEKKVSGQSATVSPDEERESWQSIFRKVFANPEARLFFGYLLLLLTALLGQDILLEPYAAEAFNLAVSATTRITSIWGGVMLIAMLVTGFLETRLAKKTLARVGGWVGVLGFALIAVSGLLAQRGMFYGGVVLLGAGTGIATISNLSLMLDMTTRRVGLYIGAWGVASALARVVGNLLSGVLRDAVNLMSQNPLAGYLTVFVLQGLFLLISLFLLSRVDVHRFQERERLTFVERAAIAGDLS
ncbi:BCD family MFS transporter [Anaerolinea thermophila]|nr:BCD family MFS transporter [Anaerolinea thermophila]